MNCWQQQRTTMLPRCADQINDRQHYCHVFSHCHDHPHHSFYLNVHVFFLHFFSLPCSTRHLNFFFLRTAVGCSEVSCQTIQMLQHDQLNTPRRCVGGVSIPAACRVRAHVLRLFYEDESFATAWPNFVQFYDLINETYQENHDAM